MYHRLCLLLLPTLAGCLGSPESLDLPLEPPDRRAVRMVATSPTAFHSQPGTTIAGPAVRLVGADGEPVPGVPVTFSSLTGGAYLVHGVVPTNLQGIAGAQWVLRSQPGENLVVASAEGVAPLAFAAVGGYEVPSSVFGLARTEGQRAAEGEVLGGYYLLLPGGSFTHSYLLGGPAGTFPIQRDHGTWSQTGSLITFTGGAGSWVATVGDDSLYVKGHHGWNPAVYSATPLSPDCPADIFPPVAPAAVTYLRRSPHQWLPGAMSRYVLLDHKAFRLQYITPASGFFEYPGTYTQADSVITFAFDAWSVTGEWRATGLLRGATLTVSYNLTMAWDDFEDGVYATPQCGAGSWR